MGNHEFGKEGEDLARSYLEKKGFVWKDSHYSTPWGEIDLVMMSRSRLVFVEVKRRRGDLYGRPEEAITKTKKDHLVKAALVYVQKKKCEGQMIRFDVVSIGPDGIQHFPNAFNAGRQFYY